MNNKLIRIKTVMEMTGKSRSAIYADMAAGDFPRSINIGARSVAWQEKQIADWIEKMINKHRERRALGIPWTSNKPRKEEYDPLGVI